MTLKIKVLFTEQERAKMKRQMSHVEKNITINARAEKVFNILNNPDTWQHKMAGRKSSEPISVKEAQKPKHLVAESSGDAPPHWEWTLNPLDYITTDVSVGLDYKVPGTFLGGIINKMVLQRQNEQMLEQQLARLKRTAEVG